MKILWPATAVFTGLIFTQNLYAAATAPVGHTHGGRNHTHPLPAQGIYHRHGNSAYGQYINRSGSITGTLTPLRQPPQASARGGTITGSLQQNPQNRSAAANTQSGGGSITGSLSVAPQRQSTKRYDKASDRCTRSARNCNVCAINVKQQFNRAASGQIDWRTDFWRFDWDTPYPPQQVRARDLLAGQKKYLLGIPDKHIQGFIHTNSTRYPFAASHSHRSNGGIMLIDQNPQGEKQLVELFKTTSQHPSGVHAIGHYLVYGELGRLILKDLEKPEDSTEPNIGLLFPGPVANVGGGLGLAKLARDGHLLVTTGPGGQDQRPRTNRFYHLQSRNGQPNKLTFINQSPQLKPAAWPAGFSFSENLSLITECGSGDIYTVHTTGDQDGINAIRGQGYWRLSKVAQQNGKLSLLPLVAFHNQQSMDKCSMRAAATVRVNPDHKLEFYCHGYAKNPNGSTLNVLGESKNTFKFSVGVPR